VSPPLWVEAIEDEVSGERAEAGPGGEQARTTGGYSWRTAH